MKKKICMALAICMFLSGIPAFEKQVEAASAKTADIRVTQEELENAKALENFQNMGVNFEMSFTVMKCGSQMETGWNKPMQTAELK